MRKFKLLVVYLDEKYLLSFKLIMLLISAYFLYEAYIVYETGIADKGSYVIRVGEHRGYYSFLMKKCAFGLFFMWLGTFGSKKKET